MPKEMVFTMSPDGKTEGLHFDNFDLGFLGKKEVRRASEIVFNEDTQLWDIHLPDSFGPVDDSVCDFKGYDEARSFEVSWLQTCMSYGTYPDTVDGITIAQSIRAGFV